MMKDLITIALRDRGITGEIADITPLSSGWHRDLHYKVMVDGQGYSARLLSTTRVFNCLPPRVLDDDILRGQLALGELLAENGIPFMPLIKAGDGSMFSQISSEGVEYRFLLFEWLDGSQVESSTEKIAYTVGHLLRRMHQVVKAQPNHHLLKINGEQDYVERLNQIKQCLTTSELAIDLHANGPHASNLQLPGLLSSDLRSAIERYIHLAALEIEKAFGSKAGSLIPVHGDLNFPNLFWDSTFDTVTGIIDFDSIGLAERVNELAWIVKWYSRSKGIQQEQFSLDLAKEVFAGYDAYNVLTADELARFPSFIWLHSCLNNNFVKYFFESLEKGDTLAILKKYIDRGEHFINISRRLTNHD